MSGLHHDGPVEWSPQGMNAGESVRGGRIGGVARIPDNKEIIADLGYPMKPEIEIHALVLVVVLNEGQE